MECPKCNVAFKEKVQICRHCNTNLTMYIKINNLSQKLYNKGFYFAQKYHLTKASKILSLAVSLDKRNIDTRNLLGLVLFQMGDIGEALKQWKISSSIKKESNEANKYIALFNENKNQLEVLNDAVKLYNEALEYIQQKNEDIAIIKLKKAIYKNPKFLKAMNLLVLLYMESRDYENAEKVAQKSIILDPSNTAMLLYRKEIESKNSKNQPGFKKELKRKEYRGGFYKKSIVSAISGVAITSIFFLILLIPSSKQKMIKNHNKEIQSYKDEIKDLEIKYNALKENEEDLKNQILFLEEEKNKYENFYYGSIYLKKILEAEDRFKNKDYTKAKEILKEINTKRNILTGEQIQTLDKLQKKNNEKLFLVLLSEGKKLMGKSMEKEAIIKFKDALGMEVEHSKEDEVLYYLGKSFIEEKQLEEAKDILTELIEKYPKSYYVKEAKKLILQIK